MNQTQKHTTGKKLLALLLALIMSVSLLPMSVFAAEVGAETPVVEGQTQQDAVLDESSSEEKIVDSQESVAEDPAPVEEPTEDDVDTLAAEGDVAVQADATINYVEKKKNVSLKNDSTFYRIFLLDCGRKYFTVEEIEGIIDLLAANNFTHIELAFGNEGLRFLRDDMSLTVNGVTYDSVKVTNAIKAGNDLFDSAANYNPSDKEELTESEMTSIINYAKSKNIGVIPLFNSPGHMYTVVKAMEKLELGTNGKQVGSADSSPNYAIYPTNATAVYFVQALMQKYVDYFKDKCTMFNIGADESGMSTDNYSAYAKLVNSNAAIVQNAGMVAMAFNDGIYDPAYKSYLNDVEFDNDIVISYWTYSNYATAESLAQKGFVINSTHNNWYYVLGRNNSNWAGQTAAKSNMKTVKCNQVDSGYTTTHGCTLAVWCDNPYVSYTENADKVAELIQTMYTQNKTYFTPVTPPAAVSIVDSTGVAVSAMKVGDTVTLSLSNNAEASWSVDKPDVIELPTTTRAAAVTGTSVTAKALKAGTATVTATVGNDTYTTTITVTDVGDVEVTDNRTITVTVGGTATDVIEGANYEGTYETKDPSIATVASAKYEKVEGETKFEQASSIEAEKEYYIQRTVSGQVQYLKTGSTPTWVNDYTNATTWTLTSSNYGSYYLKSGSYYYYYYYSRFGNSGWRTTTDQWSASTVYFNNSKIYGSSSTSWGGSTTYSNELGTPGTLTTTEAKNGTTITFKGVNEGTTYVTIGHVRYKINVIKENLDGVDSLPIQLWITNNTIEANGINAGTTSGDGWGGDTTDAGQTKGRARYINIPAAVAYGEKGVAMSDALIAAGMEAEATRYEWGGTRFIAKQENKDAQKLVFWTGRIHNSSASNIQTAWGVDYSNSGAAFNYVRYYGGKWQVSADRVNWTTVTGAGSTGGMSGCTQQLAAYYMTRTEITKEVTTDVADWGKPKGGSEYNSQVNSENYVLLDFAVQYTGSRVPDTFPVDGKTLAYHCDYDSTKTDQPVDKDSDGNYYRQLNNFRGIETKDFEVYMITVTMTSDSASDKLGTSYPKSSYTYDKTTEQIVWAIDEDARQRSGLDDYTSISGAYSGCTVGGAMDISGVEVYNQHGALITYYVRVKTTVEYKLIVNYYDETTGTPQQFWTYDIVVDADTAFNSGFARTTNPVGLVNNTVKNAAGAIEAVNWKLEDMPQISAQYRYSSYEFTKTDFTGDDYKIVNLYYRFNNDKTFVVDFGLPLVIKPSDINANLGKARITKVDIGNVSSFAGISTDGDFNITYTLKQMIDSSDKFSLQYYGTLLVNDGLQEGQTAKYSIEIIPASTVYYEDSFAKFYGSDGAEQKSFNPAPTDGSDAMGTWYVDGTEKSADQALEELGKKNNVYGYDDAYKNSTTFSMGSAKKVTVNADLTANPTAQFTFKGTGFDVISLTDNRSGAITVKVYAGSDTTGTLVKSAWVDNYYGYTQENGKWVVDKNSTECLYQIPVMRFTGLDYGEYTAVITVFYDGAFDHQDLGKSTFWLDAIRVYDPMGKNDSNTYLNDDEAYPQFIKLRTELKNSNATIDGEKKMVFIDGAEEAELEDYKNYGPNNEVYLAAGQAISFKVTANDQIASIQIGAKAPQNSTNAANMSISVNNGTAKVEQLTSATEMYYLISDKVNDETSVTITNTSGSVLSLTNLKITFTAAQDTVTLAALSDEDQANAVAAVRALFTAPEPDPEPVTFEPERFEVSWNRSTVKVGQKATLTVKTSEDVAAITVDGETITSYRTRTQRTGWGWNAKKVTYREFTYTVTAAEAGTLNYSVVATDADGVNSEAFDAPALTVQAASQRPGIGGWLDNIFDRWF